MMATIDDDNGDDEIGDERARNGDDEIGDAEDWRCKECVVIIIIMTVGDAEDAR